MSKKHITSLQYASECKCVENILLTILPNPVRWLEDRFGIGYFYTRIDCAHNVNRLEKQSEINKQLIDKGYVVIKFEWVKTSGYLELFVTFADDIAASQREGGAE